MSGIYLFRLAGVPVTVSPWYFLVLLMWVGTGGGLARGLLWGLCVTVSILVHEFGHALVARRYRLSPRVILHGWGGLCAHDIAERDRHDVLILAAGPTAGLVFGVVVVGVKLSLDSYDPLILATREPIWLTFEYLIYVNVYWSLINLLPLWPLDGGQLFRLGLLRVVTPARAERVTHVVGLVLGVVGVVVAVRLWNSHFVALLAVLLAIENGRRMSSTSASGVIRPQNKFGCGLIDDAETALAAGDFAEAARLCFQARSDANLVGSAVERMWAVLAAALEADGKSDDAADYAERAPAKLLAQMRAMAAASQTTSP